MTKPRTPQSLEDGIQRAIGILTGGGVAEVTGKSRRLVQLWADEDDDAHQCPLFQAVRLDAACISAGQQPPIFDVYARMLGQVQAPPHVAADPRDRLMEVMREVGELTGEVRAAIAPQGPGGRKVTMTEYVRIAGEAADLREQLDKLLADIDAMRAEPLKAVG